MRLLLRIMLLVSFGWIGYANIHLLGAAVDALGKTNENVGMKMQMQQIAQMLKMEYISSNTLITGSLLELIQENTKSSGRAITSQTGRDSWGTPYWAIATADGVDVVSAGADKKWRTRDDLRFQQSLKAWGYKGKAGPGTAATPAAHSQSQPRKPTAAPTRKPLGRIGP